MKSTLLIVQNIALQVKAPEEVIELIEEARQNLEVVLEEIAEGKIT